MEINVADKSLRKSAMMQSRCDTKLSQSQSKIYKNKTTGNVHKEQAKTPLGAREANWFDMIKKCLSLHRPQEEFIKLKLAPNQTQPSTHKNIIRSQKYSILTFIPMVLFNQFKYFFNFFFLCLAMTQLYKPLKIGEFYTYITPIAVVISISLIKEGYDDIKRYFRDRHINCVKYSVLNPDGGQASVKSCDLRVGQILVLGPGQRVPADVLIMSTKY